MTNEQAIEIIKKYNVYGCGYCHEGGKEIEEAFDMAIQALQADGEYISRQAIEDYVSEYGYKHGSNWIDNSVLYKFIRQLPSVAIPPEHDGCKDCKYETYPEYYYPCCECKQNYEDMWQKKPHWIEHEHEAGENWEYSRYECSECHEWSDDDSNFCPNCGMKMN